MSLSRGGTEEQCGAQALGSGIWPAMVLLSEVVQTFVLADFW